MLSRHEIALVPEPRREYPVQDVAVAKLNYLFVSKKYGLEVDRKEGTVVDNAYFMTIHTHIRKMRNEWAYNYNKTHKRVNKLIPYDQRKAVINS